MEGVSVIVSCYNSQKRIEKTLEYLFNQKTVSELNWEIIVVDNNSSDKTAAVANKIEEKYNKKNVHFKIVYEPVSGLNNARRCGVESSIYNIVLFCDDDNWLNQNYVNDVFAIMSQNEEIGIVGGRGDAIFETNEPEWFKKHEHGYAVHCFGDGIVDLTNTRQYVYGAGMAIRKGLFSKIYRDFKFITIDRKGRKLTSGGDAEICMYVKLLGKKIIFSSSLQFFHYMPKERLEWKYCRRLFNSFGESVLQLFPYDYLLFEDKYSYNRSLFKFIQYHLQKIFASYKRLFFFLFKDLEGEEYITIYETSFRIIKTFIVSYIKIYKHYRYLKNVFPQK